MRGPHRFIVTGGRMGPFDFVAEAVPAWDPDEALIAAGELHPELPRPRTAVLAAPVRPFPLPWPSDGDRRGPG